MQNFLTPEGAGNASNSAISSRLELARHFLNALDMMSADIADEDRREAIRQVIDCALAELAMANKWLNDGAEGLRATAAKMRRVK